MLVEMTNGWKKSRMRLRRRLIEVGRGSLGKIRKGVGRQAWSKVRQVGSLGSLGSLVLQANAQVCVLLYFLPVRYLLGTIYVQGCTKVGPAPPLPRDTHS